MEKRGEFSRRFFIERATLGSVVAGSFLSSSACGSGGGTGGGSGGVKVCVFSKHLQWLDYEEMGEAAAEVGFDGVALTTRPNGHVSPERASQDLPRAVEAVRKAGIDVPMLTTAITDPEDRASQTILSLADQLDIRHYRMGYFSYEKAADISARLNELKPRVKALAALNQEQGVFGGYQNHAGEEYIGAPIWDVWELIRELDSRWIGCQFDIRHTTVDGATAWPVNYRLVSSFTRMLAIKDFRWKKVGDSWQTENCPLGEGVVDFPRFIGMLAESGFSGPISVHYEYPLGGADHGARKLEMDRGEFFAALKRDLETLQGWLREGGLTDG